MNKKIISGLFIFCVLFSACSKQSFNSNELLSTPSKENIQSNALPSFANIWTASAPFPSVVPRDGACSFVIGSKAFLFGGYQAGYKKDLWEYNPSTNVWIQKASLPAAARGRTNAVAFSINGKGYIATGDAEWNPQEGEKLKDLWEYNPVSDSWTKKSDLPGLARGSAAGFAINGKGYIVGGSDFSTDSHMDDVWEYDPLTNSWTSKGIWSSPGKDLGRYNAVAFVINNKAYVGTGSGPILGSESLKDFWEYNPATNKWIQKADFGGGVRSCAEAFASPTLGYVGIGFFGKPNDENTYYGPDFWCYDPVTDKWTKKAQFPGSPRIKAAGFFVAGKGYFGTGYSPNFNGTNDYYRYLP